MKMRADFYDFGLNDVDIPTEPRPISDHRLLVYDARDDSTSHSKMRSIADQLEKGDVLVFNNSRVMPVSLYLSEERFVLLIEPDREPLAGVRVICPFKPRAGDVIEFPFGRIELTEHEPGWDVYRANIFPNDDICSLPELIRRHGQFPLPIYLRRQPTHADECALQNFFAAVDGSIAPPVAGTHFDASLLESIRSTGIGTAMVTLHVGYGTFRSFKSEYIDEHVMDGERYAVSKEALHTVDAALQAGKRVVAIGTTSARVLETLGLDWDAALKADADLAGETRIFIKPPYTPNTVRGLLTNFQYPRLPVIAMAATFVGLDQLRRVYHEAHKQRYKFYSLGDAMLLKF